MAQYHGVLRGGIGAQHADRLAPNTSLSGTQNARTAAPFNSSPEFAFSPSTLSPKSTANLDSTIEDAAARRGMLEEPFFPNLKNDAGSADLENSQRMQENDPLATQIWKLYSKARSQLPNAERMENLTWRMMAMSMRRAELDRNKGYGIRHAGYTSQPHSRANLETTANPYLSACRLSQTNSMKPPASTPASAASAARSAPSGIAQLRKSVDQREQTPQPDAMNMDDFIFPSSVGSPAGLPESPSNEMRASNASAPAIPIRKPTQSHDQNLSIARASAPSVPPLVTREYEFGYVQRHVRKTSIDERRVSSLSITFPFPHHSHVNALSATQAAC
jgi:GATA-binding protein